MNLNKVRENKKITMVLLCIVLASLAVMGFSTVLGNDVNLTINGKEQRILTYSSTVEDFLETEGILLKDNQSLSPAKDTKITQDMDIVILSPKSYQIKDGKTLQIVEAKGTTVKEVLKDLNITLNKDDIVNPSLDTLTQGAMEITIERVTKEIAEINHEIPFETVKNNNDQMFKDEKKVLTPGKVGLRVDTVENTYVNGDPTDTKVLKSEVRTEPVTQVEEVGTKERPKQPAGIPADATVKRVITMEATAYDPTAGSKTAMGTRARVGAVAVDPRVIPLGTRLYIESLDGFPTYGYAVAEDTGGAIKGNRIDLFYNTNAQARKFGRRNVKVYVLD